MNKLSLLNNTPVDLVYKYIDLSDPALNRTDSVRKDFDNNELRYSIRSALKNIPWIRYIYIIMPNERVSFLKSADLTMIYSDLTARLRQLLNTISGV